MCSPRNVELEPATGWVLLDQVFQSFAYPPLYWVRFFTWCLFRLSLSSRNLSVLPDQPPPFLSCSCLRSPELGCLALFKLYLLLLLLLFAVSLRTKLLNTKTLFCVCFLILVLLPTSPNFTLQVLIWLSCRLLYSLTVNLALLILPRTFTRSRGLQTMVHETHTTCQGHLSYPLSIFAAAACSA